MVSIIGQTSGVGYPTSKFAVNGMTISLARELGKDNIRVNAVAPGVTETDMVAALPQEVVSRFLHRYHWVELEVLITWGTCLHLSR